MHSLSPAFLSLGSWTTLDFLNHLWQSTAAGLAVLALLMVCAPLSARTRRALGWMALAKFAVPMAALAAVVARFGGTSKPWIESPALTLPANFSPVVEVAASAAAAPVGEPAAHLPIGLLLTAAWFTGFALLFAWWLVRGVRLRRRILAAALPVSAAMERQVIDAAARVGLRRLPRCATVDDAHGAGALGIFSPILILPRGLEDKLTAAELEAVLIHELVHLQRRDNLWGALQYFLVSLFWFHPLVWLLDRRLGIEAEKSCDERVLEITGDPEVYAGGLVKCVRHALGVSQPSLASVTTPPVVARMQNILAHGTRRDRPIVRGAALVTGLALLGFSGCAGSFASGVQPVEAARGASSPPPASATEVRGPALATIRTGEPRPIPRYQYNQQTGGFEVAGFDYRKSATIDFVDEDIRNIVRSVADFLELNIVMPDTLRGRSTLKAANQTWQEVFKAVLTSTGYTFVEDGNIVKIVRADSPQAAAVKPAPKGRSFVATADQKSSAAKDTLSVDFPDEDIRNIVKNIADLFQLNVVLPDTLRGKTTIKLRDVTWRQIFTVILEPVGYVYAEDGNMIRIVAKDSLTQAPLSTEVYRLSHARAADLLPALTPLLDAAAGGKIMIDARTNSLVITEHASRLARIIPMIAQLDRTADGATIESKNIESAPATEPVPVPRSSSSSSQTGTLALTKSGTGTLTLSGANTYTGGSTFNSGGPVTITNGGPGLTLGTTTFTGSTLVPARNPEPVVPPSYTGVVTLNNGTLTISPTAKPFASRIYSPTELDEQPVAITKVAPIFAPSQKQKNISGLFLIKFVVGTDGLAREITTYVLDENGIGMTRPEDLSFGFQPQPAGRQMDSQLAEAGTAALRQWTFRPGRKSGRDVDAHAQQVIRFAVSPEAQPAGPAVAPHGAPVPVATEQAQPAAAARFADERGAQEIKGMKVYDPKNLDQQPVARSQTRPLYPFEMRRNGIGGEAVVDFIVDTNGDVLNAYAVSSSRQEFEAAAVTAVSQWKFKPGRVRGENVNTHMQVPIRFTLNNR